MNPLTSLSDTELLDALGGIVTSTRHLLGRLLRVLGEVEERRLHLAQGYSSMFDFCTSGLRMSEGEAFRRLAAARLGRRFPLVLERLERGEVHLTAVVLLREHLTEKTCAELLDAARGQSKRNVEKLLAARFPRPDVPDAIRKLPRRRAPGAAGGRDERGRGECSPSEPEVGEASATVATDGDRGALALAKGNEGTRADEDPDGGRGGAAEHTGAHPEVHPSTSRAARGHRIEPLSAARYKLQLTASEELKDKLLRARDLLGHAVPDGDLSGVLERALDLLLDRLEPGRRSTTTPRSTASQPTSTTRRDASSRFDSPPQPDSKSRAVSRRVRREVFERDGSRCTYTGSDGRRCTATARLEVDHVVPRALGGSSDSHNLRLLCREHNQFMAEQTFGRQHIEGQIALVRAQRALPLPSQRGEAPG